MRSFKIIVAMDAERGIGKYNQLPWRLPGDLKAFKQKTTFCSNPGQQNAVIMGRKTWDSIPEKFRPLPNRLNMVLSRETEQIQPSGCLMASGFEAALSLLEMVHPSIETVFVIGGSEIYKEALRHVACQTLYITHIKGNFECDRFFPAFQSRFKLMSESEELTENNMSYLFAEYRNRLALNCRNSS